MQTNISKHITYKEATHSSTAFKKNIKNNPNKKQLANMVLLTINVFEPLRNHFNIPIKVNSFFRSKWLNFLIGGSKSSQHVKGQAIDITTTDPGNVPNSDLFHFIRKNLVFDQLIWEFGSIVDPSWIHVSFNKNKNRGQVLVAYKDKNKNNTKYKEYKECS